MKKFLDKIEARDLLNNSYDEFTIVQNPDYVYPEYEVVPLAKQLFLPLNNINAVVMDMDGTTTTTEQLCIHSLEIMIRKMSGKMNVEEWAGFNKNIDYPNIIGNSTTKHVEYLITKYQKLFNKKNIHEALIFSVVWSLLKGTDKKRKTEVLKNLSYFGIENILENSEFLQAINDKSINLQKIESITHKEMNSTLNNLSFSDYVRIGIEIYYQRYHEILENIYEGKSTKIATEVFGEPNRHLIEPMPGLIIFLSLIKGWLDSEVKNIIPASCNEYQIISLWFSINSGNPPFKI